MQMELRWAVNATGDGTLQYRQKIMTTTDDGSETPIVRWTDWIDVPVEVMAGEAAA